MAGTFEWGGRQWGPGDRMAFAHWLRVHGGDYRTFAGRHQAQAGLLETSPQDYRAQSLALTQAQQLAQPGIDAILADQKKARDQAARDVANSQGFTQALASMYGGIAPMVGGLYTGAAGETGQLAKGFADATTAQQAAETSGANDVLAKAGAPAAAVAATDAQIGGPVGDVLYGTTGFLPAAGLAREGAAFGAAAAQLPAYAGGIGQQNDAAIRRAASQQDQSFLDALRQERDKIPGSALDILNQQRQYQLSQDANRIQADYLGNTTRNTTANLTGVDPVTGQPTYDAQTDAAKFAAAAAAGADPDAALSKVYGHIVDHQGHAIPDANGNWVPVAKTPKAPKKPNTAKRETAFASAHRSMFSDVNSLYKTVPGDPAAPPGTPQSKDRKVPPTYVEASKFLFAKYKDLLRFSTRKGRPKLRARLNELIREVLAAHQIFPPNPPLGTPHSQPTGEHG